MSNPRNVIADLARPFALYAVAGSTAVAILRLSWAGEDLSGAAVFITAALGGLAALYGAKAWEVAKVGGQAADVEKAKAQATPPPGTAQVTAAADVDIEVRKADGGDELPPDQRVQR